MLKIHVAEVTFLKREKIHLKIQTVIEDNCEKKVFFL